MADPYADLDNAPIEMQQRIADALAARCLDPAQVALRKAYLKTVALPEDAFAVELGSGTGHVTSDLVDVAGASKALGIEPSRLLVEHARTAHDTRKDISFQVGNAKTTDLPDASCDCVLMHTLLCHVPNPEDVIAEAARVLKPKGVLAICDGDYDTATTSIGDYDPLEPLVKCMIHENVTNLWIMRQIGPMLAQAGFAPGHRVGHGYVADSQAAYFLTVIDRGADIMANRGLITPATATALKAEARDRITQNRFFGFMSYVSVVTHKTGVPQ